MEQQEDPVDVLHQHLMFVGQNMRTKINRTAPSARTARPATQLRLFTMFSLKYALKCSDLTFNPKLSQLTFVSVVNSSVSPISLIDLI